MKKKLYLVPLCKVITFAPANILAVSGQFQISDDHPNNDDYEEDENSQRDHWGVQW